MMIIRVSDFEFKFLNVRNEMNARLFKIMFSLLESFRTMCYVLKTIDLDLG